MRSNFAIYAVFVLSLLPFGVRAQAQPEPSATPVVSAAPVKWVRYEVGERKISFTMPKLPVESEAGSPCEDVDGAVYQAYAAQVVYEFAWYGKRTAPIPQSCSFPKTFGPQAFLQRLKVLRAQEKVKETTATFDSLTANIFRFETPQYVSTRYVMWSIDEWVEMTITRRNENVVDEEAIVKSIAFRRMDGVRIFSGSPEIVGDLAKDPPTLVKAPVGFSSIVIVSKPRPLYTDKARKRKVQGKLSLSVTFLANGTIGPITVEKDLDEGLTEQGLAAARRILFLPATELGKPADTVKSIEYYFSLN
jgi:hypothetical protein